MHFQSLSPPCADQVADAADRHVHDHESQPAQNAQVVAGVEQVARHRGGTPDAAPRTH